MQYASIPQGDSVVHIALWLINKSYQNNLPSHRQSVHVKIIDASFMPLDVFLRDAFSPFWVQADCFYGLPISDVAALSSRSVLPSLFIHLMPLSQDSFVLTRMALMLCHKLNAAVAMLMVVPVHKVSRSLPCCG